jgi:hypothetical protein
MEESKALEQQYSGVADFEGVDNIVTMSPDRKAAMAVGRKEVTIIWQEGM